MFEIEYYKWMPEARNGKGADVLFSAYFKTEHAMYLAVKCLVISCHTEHRWMQFKYIGPERGQVIKGG